MKVFTFFKNYKFPFLLICIAVAHLISLTCTSQTPGIIVRPAGTNGPVILDPNADGYTSINTAGFGTNDILNSEIPYKIVPPVVAEPTGDLLRGPSGSFSDFVKGVDGSGFYIFNDGTNFIFRLRLGSIISGSKGYSILVDTDGKMGNTGVTADPNYMPATTGNNGNPGFELEIVFETNFRIAVYNVDGTSTPILMSSYPITSNSQISVAASTDGGNSDYFYDFYVPFSALGISATTPIRVAATTVMAPMPAIGGPKSDIFGIAGGDYMTQWTTAISAEAPFTFNDIAAAGPGVGSLRTAAPFVNAPIIPTATNISGTWDKASYSTQSTASIIVYKGATVLGNTTVNTGGTWSIPVSGLINDDVISATAQASGESLSLLSNKVVVNACNSTNTPPQPTLTCSSGNKGINGTNLSNGWTVNINNLTRNKQNNNVTNSDAFFGTNTGSSPAITWQYSGGCSGGSPLASGSYKIYYTNTSNGCISKPAYFCAAGTGQYALAGSLSIAITKPSNNVFTPATGSIAGTTTTGAIVYLYIDGLVSQTVTAANSAFVFNNLSLLTGQQIYIVAELNSSTITTSYCEANTATITVTCFTNSPKINVSNSNQLLAAAAITGTSDEPAGTLIYVYTTANNLVATTTLQPDGSWSTGNASTIPASYNSIAGTSYYSTAQNGNCGVSTSSESFLALAGTSAARCGTLPATITETATTVSGTLSGTAVANTLVTLYEDENSIGTFTTSNGTWGPIAVNSTINNMLYPGGVLVIGITEPTKNEVICPATVTISCGPLVSPSISPASTTITVGQTVNYSISSPATGILYSLRDANDASNTGASGFGSGSSLSLLSNTFNTAGTYTINVKATSLSGSNCQTLSSASVVVTSTLQVFLVAFEGKRTNGITFLNWNTSSEENLDKFEIQKSFDGITFIKAGTVKAAGNSQLVLKYSFTDSAINAPVVFYRLKMFDNGMEKSAYSKTIALRANNELVLSSIGPNPFVNGLNLKFTSVKDAPVIITLKDITGRKIISTKYTVNKGLNNIYFGSLQGLMKGIYFIELGISNDIILNKIVIKE